MAVATGFRLLGVAVIEAAVRPDDPASIAGLPRLGRRRVGQRLVHASARGRDAWCPSYEVARPDA